MLVYKYVHPDRVDILEKGNIRFTQPYALNDPFDSNPNYNLFRKSVVKRTQALLKDRGRNLSAITFANAQIGIIEQSRRLLDVMKRELNNDFAILSLTQNKNNLLMWSHYADSHRGFVLGFDSDHHFFSKEPPRVMTPLSEVKYSDQRPIVPVFEEVTSSHDVANILFFTKSNHWEYEEEKRMLAKPLAATNKEVKGGVNIYLYKFPPEILREVIFGCLMSPELKKRVAAITKNKFKDVLLCEAQLNDKEFDLKITPYRH